MVLLVFFASTIRAELVYFSQGGQVQLPATIEGAVVRLETPDGPRVFDQSDFRKIVPGYWPEKEWEARRRAALAGDAGARFAAAWWALENGLTPQAEALLREAHAADPKHQPTARLVAMLDRLNQPCTDPDLEPLRSALGRSFEVARGPHVVLLHQHGAADVAERIDLLERVARGYYLMVASQGLELPVPRGRMVSAWFAEQSDYQSFLHAQNAGVFQSTRGYFHPTLNAVVAYDARSGGEQKKGREAVSARRREWQSLTERVDQLPPSGRLRIEFPGEPIQTLNRTEARVLLRRLERELSRRQLLLEMDRRAIDLGTAAHEMVHQLVAVSGLAPRHDVFPAWLHEGLAAQFEVIRGGRWAGISRAHDLRLPDWRSVHPPPRLAALIRDEGFGRGYQRDLYAGSWALVFYLRERHPRRFFSYIDLLRAPAQSESPGPDRTVRLFKAVFGADLESLNRDWHRSLETLETPLESGS